MTKSKSFCSLSYSTLSLDVSPLQFPCYDIWVAKYCGGKKWKLEWKFEMLQGGECFVLVVYLIVLNYANLRKVFLLCCSSSLWLIDKRPTKIPKVQAS